MQTEIQLHGKTLRIDLRPAAEKALEGLDGPLVVEMELYFSCLIRKRARFFEAVDMEDAVPVNNKLWVRFHPVMSQRCEVEDNLDGPPLTDFPIIHGERFSPTWLEIDYRDGQWDGVFGY